MVNERGHGEIAWIMLNPSTADETNNDPTIRRCFDFSLVWGFKLLRVVNLLPIRSPKPKAALDWYRASPPMPGEYFANLAYIERACSEADVVMLAWGAHGYGIGGDNARENAGRLNDEVWCLGWTAMGQPRHPLYVRGDTKPVHAEDDSRRWLRSLEGLA